MKSSSRKFRFIPRGFTYLSLLSGSVSVVLAFEGVGSLRQSLFFMLWAIVLDLMARFTAKRFHADSAFGKELYAITEMIALGVAPAMMLSMVVKNALDVDRILALSTNDDGFFFIIFANPFSRIFPIFLAGIITVLVAFVLAKRSIGFDKRKAFSGRSLKTARAKHVIPWILTGFNIFTGTIALILASQLDITTPSALERDAQIMTYLVPAAYFIGLASVFDFFDGFTARIMKAHTPLGKAFDSVSDIISFGLAPGVILYQLLKASIGIRDFDFPEIFNLHIFYNLQSDTSPVWHLFILLAAVSVPVFAATRLAKYNIDIRQKYTFIGMSTPAAAITIASLALIQVYNPDSAGTIEWITDSTYYRLPLVFFQIYAINIYFILAVVFSISFLMVVEFPMFSFKFHTLHFRNNRLRYMFIVFSTILILIFRPVAIPLIMVSYIILSSINNWMNKLQEIEQEKRLAETLGRAFEKDTLSHPLTKKKISSDSEDEESGSDDEEDKEDKED